MLRPCYPGICKSWGHGPHKEGIRLSGTDGKRRKWGWLFQEDSAEERLAEKSAQQELRAPLPSAG